MSNKSSLGIYGLGTMGSNLALNASRSGPVSVYTRSESTMATFRESTKSNKNISTFTSIEDFLHSLKDTKVLLLLVPSTVISTVLNTLKESYSHLISPTDYIVDCGNTYYRDSIINYNSIQSLCTYICIGVSGGSKGALNGPAMMVGCDSTHEVLLDRLHTLSSCVTVVGPYFMGHYVKMAHNGIEYSIMSILSELTVALLKHKEWSEETIIDFYTQFNKEEDVFLIRCINKVLSNNNLYDIGNITGQKGTGKWCVMEGLELGVDTGMMASSVFERLRTKHNTLPDSKEKICSCEINSGDLKVFLKVLLLLSYYEGLLLLSEKYKVEDLHFSLETIKAAWKKNCIVESEILKHLVFTVEDTPISFVENNMKGVDYMNSIWKINRLFLTVSNPTISTGIQYLCMRDGSGGRVLQGIRDVFGSHGVLLRGKNQSINWD